MTKTAFRLALSVAAAAVLAACSGNAPQTQPAAPAPAPAAQAPATPAPSAALLDPASATAAAPAEYKVKFDTTKGPFVIDVHRDWAPKGADRFYNLVKLGYYDGDAFFRVIGNFMVQFGINGSPAVNAKWRDANIQDDPSAGQSNKRGYVSFATAGPNTRTTQVFINFVDNANLDSMGFVPFGQVVDGMNVVDSLYGGYGEGAPQGNGPDQGRLQAEGNAYLKQGFPSLDYIKTAQIVP